MTNDEIIEAAAKERASDLCSRAEVCRHAVDVKACREESRAIKAALTAKRAERETPQPSDNDLATEVTHCGPWLSIEEHGLPVEEGDYSFFILEEDGEAIVSIRRLNDGLFWGREGKIGIGYEPEAMLEYTHYRREYDLPPGLKGGA